MRRILFLGLLLVILSMALPAGGAAAQTTPDDTTGTTAPPAAGGTSPWVLVLIGAGLGAVAGVFTGLSRRRRAQRRGGG